MKGQLLIGQFPVLLQDGATQHLLGGHAVAPGILPPVFHQVAINQIQDILVRVQEMGNGFQFLGNLIAGHEIQQVQLRLFFLAHILSSEGYLV